jgi:digeranylgeranylglycerophospholipid reductase
MVDHRVDVLVVGGGPAGLATAASAAAGGARVLVVHRDAEIGKPVRTSGGTWKSDMIALGLPASVYHEIHTASFFSSRQEAHFAFEEAARPVILDVTAAYQFLGARATQQGAVLRTGCAFRKVREQRQNSLLCEVDCRTNGAFAVESQVVVDSSGSARAVLSALGLGGRPPRFGVGVEYGFAETGGDPHHVNLFVGNRFAPSGYGWTFPAGRGLTRVGIGVLRPDTPRSPSDLMTAFVESAEPKRMGLRLGEVKDKHFGVIPSEGLPERFVHGRVVAVGDAAAQALTLVGEGIRFSIEAGARLGEYLHRATTGGEELEAELLAYESWWNARYRKRFNYAQRANELMGRFCDRDWEAGLKVARTLSGIELRAILRMEFSRGDALRWAMRAGPLLAPALVRMLAEGTAQRVAGRLRPGATKG